LLVDQQASKVPSGYDGIVDNLFGRRDLDRSCDRRLIGL
jgi:hypothetical protein